MPWRNDSGWPTRSCCPVGATCRRAGPASRRTTTLYGVDEEQDAFDLALGRWALRDGIPLLGICRGNQIVNVARGGELVQDMTEATGLDHRHLVHDLELDADSPLREIVVGDQTDRVLLPPPMSERTRCRAAARRARLGRNDRGGHHRRPPGVVSGRPVAPRGFRGRPTRCKPASFERSLMRRAECSSGPHSVRRSAICLDGANNAA